MPNTVSAVLFDLDNTLADRDLAFLAWARWFMRDRLGLATEAAIEEAVAALVALDDGGRAPKDAVFLALKERHAVLTDPVDTLADAFRDQLLAHLPPMEEGAALLLAALDGAGIRWGIVSNGSRGQLRKIRKLALDARACCIVISEVVGVRKPDAAIFRLAADQLGVAPADVLFVGDHPEADVLGAAEAGMQTAWLRRGREWPTRLASRAPLHSVESLADLLWIAEAQNNPEGTSPIGGQQHLA